MEQYIFASDPHGRGKPWIDLVKKAQKKYPHAQLVFGGDYIDGRKDSKMNLDFIIQEIKENNAVALLGNHEQLMLDFLDKKDQVLGLDNALWLSNGGKTTIRSIIRPLFHKGFSLQKSSYLIKNKTPYYNFLKKLPLIYETKDIIFVHAGVNPLSNNYMNDKLYKNYRLLDYSSQFTTKELYFLWSRDEYFWDNQNKTSSIPVFNHNLTGKTIVTGHTPTCLLYGQYDNADQRILKQLPFTKCPVRIVQYPNEPARIFTDNGCHSKMQQHKGNIVVLNDKGNILETFC